MTTTLYIITNGVAATQYHRLGKSGLDRYFKDIFISEEAASQKPQPEYFEYCFKKMGRRDVENMLVIGDSLTSDIKGGNNVGYRYSVVQSPQAGKHKRGSCGI